MAKLNIFCLSAIIPWVICFEALPTPAQSANQSDNPQSRLCPPSVLSRLIRHRAQSGDTLASIAQKYGLSSVTLQGMNPRLRQGQVEVGTDIVVPPYNGILVAVPAGQTLGDVAQAYRVTTEVLFELNGCQASPEVAFVPGVNWSPSINSQPTGIAPLRPLGDATSPSQSLDTQDRYPLPQPAAVIGTYGWRLNPETSQMQFYSGVDLRAEVDTPVYTVSSGTVVSVGERGTSGQTISILHTEGRQTRYGRLGNIMVQVGQQVQAGDPIGTVGAAETTSLRFEVRYRARLGWVAHDPQSYLRFLQK